MAFLLLVLVLFAVAVAWVLRDQSTAGQGARDFPYQRGAPLFSPAERAFLGVLDQAVGHQYRVFGKVLIADLVQVQRGILKAPSQKALQRIGATHFQFVLCHPGDLALACVIELADRPSPESGQHGPDGFVAGVCRAARLPFACFPVKAGYTLEEIQHGLAAAMSLGSALHPESGLPVTEVMPSIRHNRRSTDS